MSIRFRLSFLIIFLFIAAISNSVFTFWLEKLGEEKLRWVNHTHTVLYTTQKLLSAMKDAETGQRGYLLTNDASYLEPYHNGLVIAEEEYLKLKALTSENTEQQNILLNIREQMQYKFDELAKTISLAQKGQKSAALELVSRDKGKEYMDTIRSYISTFTNNEFILLEKRKGDFRENRAEITTIIFVEAGIFIGLAIITFLFMHNNLFYPLKLLVRSSERVEKGQRLEVSDIVGNDEMGHLLSAFYKMSDKVYKREKSLDRKAKHDNLTGLKNRSTLLQEIEKAVTASQKAKNKTAVLFMDLNLFKQINDSLGHDYGDLILKETASRLLASVRYSDTVFRLGGDEFLIILRNIEDITNVFSAIEKIQEKFKEPADINGKAIDISISIGVSISPDDSTNSLELIEFSDIAMYASKRDKTTAYKRFERSMLRRSGDRQAIKYDG